MRNHWRFQVSKHTPLGIDPRLGWLGIFGGPPNTWLQQARFLQFLPPPNRLNWTNMSRHVDSTSTYQQTMGRREKHEDLASKRWWNIGLKPLMWRQTYGEDSKHLWLCSNHQPLQEQAKALGEASFTEMQAFKALPSVEPGTFLGNTCSDAHPFCESGWVRKKCTNGLMMFNSNSVDRQILYIIQQPILFWTSWLCVLQYTLINAESDQMLYRSPTLSVLQNAPPLF